MKSLIQSDKPHLCIVSAFIVMAFIMMNSTLLAEGAFPIVDTSQPLETRVEDLLSRLTLEEKISHHPRRFKIHHRRAFRVWAFRAAGWTTARTACARTSGRTPGSPPAARMIFPPPCRRAFVSRRRGIPIWVTAKGEAIGQEARERGKDIMLGPGVNILRTPLCGRNFEYLGEDPFLTSRMAVGYIRGEQSQDISSCVKHFALNNQEFERGSINVEVDERALREIYLPAFKAAVQEGGVWSVMGAYNQFRGQHCCENDYLLNKILKDEWGFKGLVMSDWGGAHDTREAALNGLDLEMGTETKLQRFLFRAALSRRLENQRHLPMAGLDEKVRRNLRVMFATHVFDPGRNNGSLNTAAHQTVARHVAEEGIVLLKNENHSLPLDAAKIKTIAVIGENATRLQSRTAATVPASRPFTKSRRCKAL